MCFKSKSLLCVAVLKQQGSVTQGNTAISSNGQQQQHLHHHFSQGSVPQQQQQQQQQSLQSSLDPSSNVIYGSNINQQQSVQSQLWGANQTPNQTPNNTTIALNITAQIEAINMQQNALREQIHQSEANLSAQHSVN